MGDVDPLFGGYERHQILFDFLWGFLLGQAQPLGEPLDMGVDDDAVGQAKTDAAHDVGGLAGHAGQPGQFIHLARHFAAEFLADQSACALDALGFVAKETGGTDQFLQLRAVGGGHCFRRRETGEQGRRHLVDPLVGALGRKDRRHQQLKRALVV